MLFVQGRSWVLECGGSKLGGLGRKPAAGVKFFLELHVAFSAL